MAFTHFVVGVDFSPGSDHAFEAAIALAATQRASMHLVHVVQDPLLLMPWSEDLVFDLRDLRDALLADAERRLSAMAASHPEVVCTVEAVVGAPAETIVRVAADRGADLIVVGTHGRHGVSRPLTGSVAERVLRMASCPVLTVRDMAARSPFREAVLAGNAHAAA